MRSGWYRDPFGRLPYRYWDGEIWTEHVYSGDDGKGNYERDVLTLDRGGARIPENPWRATFGTLGLSIGGLAVAFGLSYLFILPFLLLGHPGGVLVALVLSEAGLWTGLLGTCVLASRRYGTGSLRNDFRVRFRWLDLLIGIVAAVVARCVAAIVLVPFIHVLKSAGNPDKSLLSLTQLGALGWCVLVVFSCIGAPFFEELFFRGLLQGQLVDRFGPAIAIAATSIVFGAAHIANDPGASGLLLALSVGASGVALGVVRQLTGRLGSSMVTHGLFNAIAVIVLAAVGAK